MAILTPLFIIFEQNLLNFVNFWLFLAGLNAPYYLLRGGGLNRNSQYDAGASGSYWSSTPDGFSYAYYLFFYSDYMGTSYVYRYYGYSVRCVAAG